MPTPLELTFQRVLGRSLHDLRPEDGPDTLDDWDSHAHLELLSQLEEAYGISFSLAEQLELNSVARIRDALHLHGVRV